MRSNKTKKYVVVSPDENVMLIPEYKKRKPQSQRGKLAVKPGELKIWKPVSTKKKHKNTNAKNTNDTKN